VEVYRRGSGTGYDAAQVYNPGDAVPVPVKPDAAIPAGALLGLDSPTA
jgi:hypothetical protein